MPQSKQEVQNAPKGLTLVRDHGHWGDFKLRWMLVFNISPANHFGITLLYLVKGFFSEECNGILFLTRNVRSTFKEEGDVVQGPIRAAVHWTAFVGVGLQERSGWMT